VQVAWVARLWLPAALGVPSLLLLVLAELAVPVWAEHAAGTRWHPSHIAERYGLFTLIVLGEAVLAATTAIQSAFDAGGHRGSLLGLSAAGLITVYAMWWIYFDRPGEEVLGSLRSGFGWGYGHYLIFAAAAAVGAGIVVNVAVVEGDATISGRVAAWTVAVPVAIYLACVWLLHRKPGEHRGRYLAFPVVAALVLATPLLPAALAWIAALTVALVAITVRPGDAE
jgi:low temperature requirement protein LtrA